MGASKLRKRKAAGGFSIVSMMIGIAISLVVLSSLLGVYQNTIFVSQTSIARANLNAAVESSLLTIQRQIQEAGFGSSSSMSTNLVVLKSAVLSGGVLSGKALPTPNGFGATSTGNALVWSWVEPKTSQTYCQGIVFTGGQLLSLDETACSGASSSWSSIQWTNSSLVSTGLSSSSNISLGFGFCSNYGSTGGPVQTATINPIYADGSINKLSQTYCLTN